MTPTTRVLWMTERYPPMPGGMSESSGRQVYGLRRRDLDVDTLVLISGAPRISVSRKVRDGGTDLLVHYPNSVGDAVQRAWRLVQEEHLRRPYALLVGFGANLPGYVSGILAAWLDRPSICMIRGNDFDRDLFEPRRAAYVNEALRRATTVGAVTLEKVRRIEALFPGKPCTWTPNGIDAQAWRLLPADVPRMRDVRQELAQEGRRIVGLFGELKYKKRVPFWLEALRAGDLVHRVSLLIVGRMDDTTDQLLADPGIAPPSKHLSFRSKEELPHLYHACDYIAIPSLFEGFPNVLLEAMACGAVPIVSDAGAMGDVVTHGETGFVFPAEDLRAATEATREALALTEEGLHTMKAKVRALVAQEFSLDKELDVLVGLIDSACGQEG